jgi:hypothetical protein
VVGVSMVRSDFEIAAVPTNVSDFETCERGCEVYMNMYFEFVRVFDKAETVISRSIHPTKRAARAMHRTQTEHTHRDLANTHVI